MKRSFESSKRKMRCAGGVDGMRTATARSGEHRPAHEYYVCATKTNDAETQPLRCFGAVDDTRWLAADVEEAGREEGETVKRKLRDRCETRESALHRCAKAFFGKPRIGRYPSLRAPVVAYRSSPGQSLNLP